MMYAKAAKEKKNQNLKKCRVITCKITLENWHFIHMPFFETRLWTAGVKHLFALMKDSEQVRAERRVNRLD